MIDEPAVSLTDYALAIECAVVVVLLLRAPASNIRLKAWVVLFFVSLGVAALAGGTSHGFLQGRHLQLDAIAWTVTLLAIGMVGLAGWNISASLIGEAWLARLVSVVATLIFIGYVLVVLLLDQRFLVAILYYLPANIFLLLLLLWRFFDTGHGWLLAGISGLALALVAAGVQQSGIVIHPVWLDQNVLYHMLQAVAILFIYWFAHYEMQYSE